MNSKLLVCLLTCFCRVVSRAVAALLASAKVLHFTPQDLDIAYVYLQGRCQLFDMANPTLAPDRFALILDEKDVIHFENSTSYIARYFSKSAKSFFKYKNKLKKSPYYPGIGLSCQYIIGCVKSQEEHVLPDPSRKQGFKRINIVTA